MPDLGEFEALSKHIGKHKACGIKRALTTVKSSERGDLEAALKVDEIRPGAIVKWCERRGVDGINPTHVIMHRRGTCQCARDAANG